MDAEMRMRLRAFRSNPDDETLAANLARCLDRADMLPDSAPKEGERYPMVLRVTPEGPNRTSVETHNGHILYSYSTAVAVRPLGDPRGVLVSSELYSNTTQKHIRAFFPHLPRVVVPQSEIDSLASVG